MLATFALGTAAGDLTAAEMNLGFLTSGILFGAIVILPAVAWWKFQLNAVFAFWAAYVATRALGASFADWLGKPHSRSGLAWGDGPVCGIAALIIIALVIYISFAPDNRELAAETRSNQELAS